MKEAYRRILHQARPVSAHPRMELENRAKAVHAVRRSARL